MNVLVCGYTWRTVDNFRPLVDGLAARGHRIGTCFFPHNSVEQNHQLGDLPYTSYAVVPADDFSAEIPPARLAQIIGKAMDEHDCDVVLLDDILNYPSNGIHRIVADRAPHIPVIAFQHGFFQFWERYRRNFACDHFIAFGVRDKRELFPLQQERTSVLGLAKLARLRGVQTSDDGSVLFIGQDMPRWEVITMALTEFVRNTGKKVRVRLHPQHASYAPLGAHGFEILGADTDITPQIASASAVITTGSTAGMEALVLGKPVVALPSYSSVIFRSSPCIAYDYTGREIERVLGDWHHHTEVLKDFMDDAIADLSFHPERATSALEDVIESCASRSRA